MRAFIRRIITASFVLGLVLSAPALALDVPPAPPLDRPIVDTTGMLTDAQITALSEKIATLRKEKSVQIGVLMIPTLDDEALEDYSLSVARTWGIGEKSSNNGVLLFIAKDDHQLRIEAGNGQEGDLTDLRAGRIIRNVIAPKFKQNDFYGGIDAGVTEIIGAVQMKPDTTKEPSSSSGVGGLIEGFFVWGWVLFIGAGWLGSVLARSKSWWAGGVIGGVIGLIILFATSFAVWSFIALAGLAGFGFLFDFLVSRNYKQHAAKGSKPSWWAGGGWGGGSSGGGFSGGGGSFGGGGFSGGGASGSW